MKNILVEDNKKLYCKLIEIIGHLSKTDEQKIEILQEIFNSEPKIFGEILLSNYQNNLILYSVQIKCPDVANFLIGIFTKLSLKIFDKIVESENLNDKVPLKIRKQRYIYQKLLKLKDPCTNENILHLLCKNNYTELLKKIIRPFAETNSRNFHGQSPLILAVKTGNLEMASILIKNSASVNAKDYQGETCLHESVKNKDFSMIQLLLRKKSSPEAVNQQGKTPMHYAIDAEYTQFFQMLMRKNDLDSGYIFLQYACLNSKFKSARKLLELGVKIKEKDQNGQNLLHMIASLPQTSPKNTVREIEFVQILLVNKFVDIDAKDYKDNTALHLAGIHGNFHLAVELINRGAETESENQDNNSFLMIAIWKFLDPSYLIGLLRSVKSDINGDKASYRPLHVAVLNYRATAFTSLIRFGADINVKNEDGATALHCAIIYNHPEFVRKLIQYGAEVNLQDKKGQTSLHFAAKHKNSELITMLTSLSACVDPNITDNRGWTALHVAAFENNLENMHLLKMIGADIDIEDHEGNKAADFLKNKEKDPFFGEKVEYFGFTSFFQSPSTPNIIDVNSKKLSL